MQSNRYIIGIDLGTTNCTMAYAQASAENPDIVQFKIPQVVGAGTQDELYALPSFIYFPLPEELKAKLAGIQWDPQRGYCVGAYARDRGAEIASRLIASAKSWLCHAGIDRKAPMMPMDSEDLEEKMSPLQACATLLSHLKEAWEEKMAGHPFDQQQVLVTVPASFDPSARQLVLEAAKMAGFPEIVLLEEPQAAFYSWLQRHEQTWRKQLKVGDCVLVVDIGGGTTDFSLIAVEEEQGDLTLKRIAVGSHLLLGGDNIDLSLAYLARNKLEEEGHTLDDFQFQSLVHACRKAKEALLADKPPKSFDITIMGRGSRLIGNSLTTSITKAEAEKVIVEGFIPMVEPEERSSMEKRMGFQQIGLPYAQDPRISCQLAKFLSMTGEADSDSMDQFLMPTAVLFNGGTLKAAALRNKILDVLNKWAKRLSKSPVKVLPNPDYDHAVSHGSVYYGLSRSGQAIRIKSGTSRSYFIGVEDALPAVPGIPTPLKAVCVAPFGMEEGSELELPKQEFALVVGQPTLFRFFSRSTPALSNGSAPVMGTVVRNWKQELTELPSIETRLDKQEDDNKTLQVKLKSRITELGVLELWCVAADQRKWKLEFDVRHESQASAKA